MVAPKVASFGNRNPPPKIQELVASSCPPSIISSYYVQLIVKILLIFIILFTLPKLVTTETTNMMAMLSTTKERSRRANMSQQQHRHHIYKRFHYKLRSLRDDCQNNLNKPCALLIPEESLNCVNQCISPACYDQVYTLHSTTVMESNENRDRIATTASAIVVSREPLENGEIDVARANEFDQCVRNELRQQSHSNDSNNNNNK